jgi:hypothetical protein
MKQHMAYIFITTTDKGIKEEEIQFITVQALILSNTLGNGQARRKIRQLARYGQVTLQKGVIAWRKKVSLRKEVKIDEISQ